MFCQAPIIILLLDQVLRHSSCVAVLLASPGLNAVNISSDHVSHPNMKLFTPSSVCRHKSQNHSKASVREESLPVLSFHTASAIWLQIRTAVCYRAIHRNQRPVSGGSHPPQVAPRQASCVVLSLPVSPLALVCSLMIDLYCHCFPSPAFPSSARSSLDEAY